MECRDRDRRQPRALLYYERMEDTQSASPVIAIEKVSGAIGVSGVTADQDEQVAKAGLEGLK
jgi:uncharacterized protein GlcG (DUF336 family)